MLSVRSLRPRRRIPATWATTDRPRVLVETADKALEWACEVALERAGYAVATCPGPDRDHACPLVERGACTLVAQADVVVSALPSDHRSQRRVGYALTALLPEKSVVVDVPAAGEARLGGRRLSGAELLRSVRATLLSERDRRRRRDPVAAVLPPGLRD